MENLVNKGLNAADLNPEGSPLTASPLMQPTNPPTKSLPEPMLPKCRGMVGAKLCRPYGTDTELVVTPSTARTHVRLLPITEHETSWDSDGRKIAQ